MIKLITIDLDGTLLKDHYIISKENMDAIEYAKKKGVLVGVNTGRNSTSAAYFSEKAGMNAPVVCCGGSLILEEGMGVPRESDNILKDISKRNVLLERRLPKHALQLAWEIAKDMDISFYAQSKGAYYIVGKQKQNEFVYDWDKKAVSIIDMGLKHYEDFDGFMNDSKGNVVKMGFSSMNRDLIDEIAKKWEKTEDIQTTLALNCILEITCKNSNKGSAIEFLREYYGLGKDEVAGIGDDINDLAMFKACGTSVAIGDGYDAVKQTADYVACGCKENGVADGIRYLLGE